VYFYPVKAYFISGIGADYRLFTHIRLPGGYEPFYIHWIPPQPSETLPSYAYRLTDQIDTTEPFVLIGLSLGGIMAVEIAKSFPPACTIIISSVPKSSHLPIYFSLAHRLQLTKATSPTLIKFLAAVKHRLTMKSPNNRKIMREIIRSGNDEFITWAMDAVLKWENAISPQPLYHIHGTRDLVFPIKLTTPTHIIPKGGHMMVMNQPAIINSLLAMILAPLS
jgi:pimeloyl-ACP methyl ester carboxylesterase